MAGKPQKNLAYSVLLDFYGPVLTDKQRVILTEYYDEDLSLAEIAENLGITRQGVRDAIKHGEAALDELEQKLGNARRHTRMQADLDRLRLLVRGSRTTPRRCSRSYTAWTRRRMPMAFESLTERLNGVFKKLRGKGKLNEADIKAAMREVRMALLEADVNYKVAKDFCAQVSERAMGQEVMESLTPAQQVVKIVNEELTNLMGGNEPKYLRLKNKGQTVLMMCGLQGNGKTTHAAKLGKYYRSQGRRPLLVACDIYRPAAIEQLKVVGEQAGVPVFTLGTEKPEIIAQKALAYAKDHGNDIVILDTAGRLQIDDQLMDELVRIKQAVEVDETLLVVDAMAGQEAVNVAKTFNEKVGISGVILTKTDGDTRGGAALSVLAVTGMPIYFQGTGEKIEDLEPFYPARMANRILGMGDVLSLIEKAQTLQNDKEAEAAAKRLMENKFDMNDLLAQFQQVKKMGGASALLAMMPGGGQIDADSLDEKALPRIEAIIYSMTPAERAKPDIINPKRKRRIAAGSGTTVEDVNKLLRQFEMMQKMMKKVKRNPKGFMRSLGSLGGRGGGFRGFGR